MIVKVPLLPNEWTLVGTGPHSLFWGIGNIRIAFGDAAPANQYDSLYLSAHGQVKSFTYSGKEGVWVRPATDVPLTISAVQISASELFLVDGAGNVLVDAADGGVI
jgi:hypothetical protein